MALTRASWSSLTTFLTSEAEVSIVLSFQQIERILGHALPASAHKHAGFWSNTSSYSWAWRDAGRLVSRRGLLPEQINFRLRHPMSDLLSPPIEDSPLHIVPVPGISSADVEASDGAGFEQGADVLLLGGVKLKASSPRQAKDLYLSDLFRKQRGYADQRGLPWFVLSAEHGLLRPNDLVAPYDVALTAEPASYRRVWGAWVIERLRRELGGLTGVRLEVHAGDAYAEAMGEPARAAGAKLIRPLQGLILAEQLAWYLAHSGLLLGPTSLPSAVFGAQARTGDKSGSERVDAFVTSLRDVTLAIQLAQLEESQVPAAPGLYSWWVDEAGAAALTQGLGHRVDPGLVYAGQAGATRWPSGERTSSTLRGLLIGMQRDGSVSFSTFRQTLAAGLNLASAGRADEGALTEWMRLHLAVAWRSTEDADGLSAVERNVLALLDPVLNLRGMHGSDVRSELNRRRSKRAVLAAPVLPARATDGVLDPE